MRTITLTALETPLPAALHRTKTPTTATTIPQTPNPALSLIAPPSSIFSFPITSVAVGPALTQLTGPQLHPLGQHPLDPSHPAQPLAQPSPSAAVVVAAGTFGTAIVTPELSTVSESVDGQEVCEQSRPMRQQPAPG